MIVLVGTLPKVDLRAGCVEGAGGKQMRAQPVEAGGTNIQTRGKASLSSSIHREKISIKTNRCTYIKRRAPAISLTLKLKY